MSDLTKRIAQLSPAQLEELRLRLKSKETAPQNPVPAVTPRRRETNVSPQSFGQQRLWILNQLQPGNPAYNIPTPMRFVGRLDVPLLERVLTEIVRRHESLRTRFAADEGEPVQIVEPPFLVTLAITDIGHLAEDEREAEVRRLANQDAQQPFDLSQAPLWRARLLRVSERDQVLLLTTHHIVTDAWSLSVLLREIVQLYKAFASGRPSPLTELEVQYADYSVWQREWLQGKALETQLAYWKQNLAGAPVLLELPTDHPRPPVQTFNGARVSLNLGRPLSDALVEFSRREGVTLFVTLLAAFKALLYRYSGQPDIIVGSPVANRKGAEVEKLIGFFVNTVAIRTKISGDPTFREFLRQVRDAALGAISHQDVPFERVVEEVTPERNLSHSPLFQTVLALQNIRVEPWDLQGLQFHPIEVDSGHAKFDISLSLMNSEQGISGRLEYNTDLFEEVTIRRMVEHLRELLGAAVAAPEQRLRELPLLTAEERRLLAEWNNTPASFPRLCVHERIEQQAEQSPDAVAVSHEGRSLTYSELDRRANRLAHFLRRQGAGREVLVAILMERSVEMVVALLGVLKAGAAYVPLDAGYPAERLRYMVRDSGAGVVLTQAKLRPLLAPEAAGGLRVVCMDEARAEIASESDSRLDSGVTADNLAYVIYTSGSTGRPKGAMIPHGALANHMYWIQQAHPLGESDAVLQKTPFSFDVSVWEFFWPLMVGARLELARAQADLDHDYLTRLIDERHITVVYFVASALQMFLSRRKGGSCRSLRYVFCGGEAMPLHVQSEFFQRFPTVELRNIYGPTETTIDVTSLACEPMCRRRSVPIGRPIANTEIHLLDADLKPVPVGFAGELYVGGANLGRGYWQRAALTAEKFIPHPLSKAAGARLYRSGDLARFQSDGSIEFLGRIDHQVKVRGFRIELGEIDAALTAHPYVSECVTVLCGTSPSDKRIVSYIVPDGGEVSNSELRAFLRERLPEYMTPGAFLRLDELPRTPNGKIDREGLPEPNAPDREPAAPFARPETDLEQTLAGLWREALKVEEVSLHDNFFDLGGHSLLLVQIHGQLQEQLELKFSPIELFRYPTIGLLAGYLRGLGAPDGGGESPADEWLTQARERASARRLGGRAEGMEIAIIGIAGRFPGAASLEEFWEHLRDGVEAVRDLSDEELLAAGMNEQVFRQERYVRKGCVLDGIEWFDAEFFGMTPREAELMDPQQRMFLECAWEAMENAGYDASNYGLPIGVFAGSGTNSYMFQLYSNRELFLSVGGLQTKLLNDKDFLSSRVSYRLGLRGPSLTVQTACSTSLVAVHLACQSLLNGECSMALAGGVSITVPQRTGYAYQEGGIISPDGHCRPFDARAAGTVGGSGAALLLLKPLHLALHDRDHIRAVIKGSAINNDGSLKVGYTAPSIDGQAAVIAEALAVSGLSPSDISYVEAHGTATPLGDPVEVAALNKALGQAHEPCVLGSVKSNVGHMDAAAGVAGLVKTVLALEHELIPPTLHYELPNPVIEFGRFEVSPEARPWPRAEGQPRRAGVSSFGIGGTNAHLIVEEAPSQVAAAEQVSEQKREASGSWEVLVLSARTEAALGESRRRLAERLEAADAPALGDAAYTLQVGRRAFAQRAAVVCRDPLQAASALRSNDPRVVLQSVHETSDRPVAFMFPGVGDHYVGMTAGLYETEPIFRKEVDRCAEILKPHLGSDLREVIYAGEPRPSNGEPTAATHLNLRGMLGRGLVRADARSERLNETVVAQPAVFVVEYALAKLLMEWGVQPQAMIGYSIGEYVAACLAGVFSLEDALALVAGRARMIQALPGGAMLAVSLSEEQVRPDVNEHLWLAAINGPELCVVAGEVEAVEAYGEQLRRREVACRRLPTTHAFHSGMMEPIVEDVTELASGVRLYAPQLGYISNVTGTWINAAEAAEPGYWAGHMRRPVRFADGLRELWREPGRLMLEVGPGQSLTSLALQQRPAEASREGLALPTLRTPYEQQSDEQFLLGTAARLWLAGYAPAWERMRQHEPRRRVPLPTYSFDRQYYWLPQAKRETPARSSAALTKKPEMSDWFYIPSWKRERPLASLKRACGEGEKHSWLIFLDAGGIGARVASLLKGCGHEVVTVTTGEGFARVSVRGFQINPSRREDYESLVEAQRELGRAADRIVHLWGLNPRRVELSGRDSFEEAQEVGFYSLLLLARALGRSAAEPLQLAVVTDRIQEVTGDETLDPEMSTVLGPCKVIPQEYPDIVCRSIDLALPRDDSEWEEMQARDLLNELLSDAAAEAVAHRGGHRWVQSFEALKLRPEPPAVRLREGGAYVLFGGLGRIGLTLAEYLWLNARARLVLTGRTGLPPREDWDEWLELRGESETAYRISKVRALEAAGAEVLVHAADVADLAQTREVLRQTRARFGDPRGVIYLAGLLGAASFCPIQETTRVEAAVHFAPKAHGLYVLEEALEGLELDFCVLFSSLASVLGGLGFTAYAAANIFIDSFVRRHNRTSRTRWLSEDWDTWLVREDEAHSMDFKSTQSELNMTPEQGQAAFAALLAAGDLTQVVVSVGDLQARLDKWIRRESGAAEPAAPAYTGHARPGLHNAYVAPRSKTEQAIADIWQEVLGIEPIGVYDSFFGLGGHSLLGTQVISRIRKQFQEDISVRTFFSSPTVADLAEAVVQKRLERVDSATLAQLITDVRQAAD